MLAPTARAYFSMVASVGRVRTPVSRRDTTLLVLGILSATSCCGMPAAARVFDRGTTNRADGRSWPAAPVRDRVRKSSFAAATSLDCRRLSALASAGNNRPKGVRGRGRALSSKPDAGFTPRFWNERLKAGTT
jgi:hypothetical protein